MSDMFETKVRRVGTSLGVLIPKEIIERDQIKEGENVKIGLLKERKLREVLKLFGSAKETKPFVRDKTDRLDRY
jgi:antitoxin component of MazEF toxin-antitoxin module